MYHHIEQNHDGFLNELLGGVLVLLDMDNKRTEICEQRRKPILCANTRQLSACSVYHTADIYELFLGLWAAQHVWP